MSDRTVPMFINGEWISERPSMPVINPATENSEAVVPVATPDDCAAALRGARDAQLAWAADRSNVGRPRNRVQHRRYGPGRRTEHDGGDAHGPQAGGHRRRSADRW